VGIGVALALALWLAWERPEAERGAADLAPAQRVPSDPARGTPDVEQRGEATARRPDPSRDAERTLLEAQLARALPDSLSAADLQRLAELLLEARDPRRDEPPRVEREIQARIAEEFERIAGEPMGTVTSRLSTPSDSAPRPPGETDLPRFAP
jgi:hypothetical protein